MNDEEKAGFIFDEMQDRLIEYVNKAIDGNINEASSYVYAVGFVLDIKDALKKIKRKELRKSYRNTKRKWKK